MTKDRIEMIINADRFILGLALYQSIPVSWDAWLDLRQRLYKKKTYNRDQTP